MIYAILLIQYTRLPMYSIDETKTTDAVASETQHGIIAQGPFHHHAR